MQETLMQILDILGTGAELSYQNLAASRFAMNFICECANLVIDRETGELLEYIRKNGEYHSGMKLTNYAKVLMAEQ